MAGQIYSQEILLNEWNGHTYSWEIHMSLYVQTLPITHIKSES